MNSRGIASTSLPGVATGLGLALVSGLMLLMPGPAGAVSSANDGSDWSAQGSLSSDSAVTVQWDNTGNPTSDVVERDSRQKLAHTDGKTYASVSKTIRDAYAAAFGSGNGQGGLRVSVSQTEGLVDQSVTVDVSGATGGTSQVGSLTGSYVQIFQCWGAMGADGKPDPDATDPDPSTCQVGAQGPDAVPMTHQEDRFVGGDAALLKGGDWATYASAGPSDRQDPPFLSVDGQEDGSVMNHQSTLFNSTTTNELSHATVDGQGKASRSFETQTGTEAPGLGCGYRSDQASTRTCWLVIVPRLPLNVVSDTQMGPISPSIWAQRLQVKLAFQDVPTACPSGRSRALISGSETLGAAFGSWTPGVCNADKLTLGYSTVPDPVARTEYAAGASDAILTTQPLAPDQQADYVPVALDAPVIGYTLDYVPECPVASGLSIAKVTTEADAEKCGYASLDDLQSDLAKSGQQVRDLRLSPLLIAKMLTQSYRGASMSPAPSWMAGAPANVLDDAQFQALNPQLHLGRVGGDGDARMASTLLVEASRSDAAAAIWSWLLADPATAAFLSGCPDAEKMTVNPFYSSRTYIGCASQSATLEAKAAAARAATKKPSTYVDQAISYPPDGSPYPLPDWLDNGYAAPASRSMTETDWLPRDDSMALTARDTFNGGKPAASSWCQTTTDSTCLPAPGKYVAPSGKQAFGHRQAFTITDSASAARYRLPTASLCDDDGSHCAAATTASLHAAAGQFDDTTVPGVQQPGPAEYADGAYPLTLPVYAAVRPTLAKADRDAYADALTYITGTGQIPGFDVGDLPPGYAPLTAHLTAQAARAIAALRAGTAAGSGDPGGGSSSTGATAVSAPTASATAATSSSTSGTGAVAVAAPPGDGVPSGAATSAASAVTVTPGALAPAAAGTESWPRFTLPLGLAIALLSGLAGPLMRTRVRWKVGR
ncbi:hypothetical protein P5P86_02790 [Nocardioides sp. BP30]|uniref:hypothetical protein n=1 Tax=Nocardioides sp. BP30 TaxID=3036374 RepID=UPI0024698ECD|nr:hypothetical protein [Nocardioides sp. BP30]WGL52760.1 hypothetical protein P5P86_02790 [Nocardioides sp. BP30]